MAGMILKFADELEPGDVVHAVIDGMPSDGWQSREAFKAGCIVAHTQPPSEWGIMDVTWTTGDVTSLWHYSLLAVRVQAKELR